MLLISTIGDLEQKPVLAMHRARCGSIDSTIDCRCQGTFCYAPQAAIRDSLSTAMALPRRVPWANQEEYEEVFSLLFGSNGDLEAQRRAVNRVRFSKC